MWIGSFEQLLGYVSVGLAVVSGLVVASVFPIRRQQIAGTFRLPLYPLPPLIYLGLVSWTVIQQVIDEGTRMPALLSLGTILAGIPLAGCVTGQKDRGSVVTSA